MSNQDLAESVREAAAYGFKFAADKQQLSLHAVDATWVASVVATHALNAAVHAGEMIGRERHEAEMARLKRREAQLSNWWACAKVEADRQLHRAQSALSEIEDRELAQALADKIGIVLPEESGALFEEATA